MINKYYFTLFLLLAAASIQAQQATMEELEAALSLKLCNYVIWPQDTDSVLKIGIYTKNQDLWKAFVSMSSGHLINNKRVEIIRLNSLKDIPQIELLFLGRNTISQFPGYRDIIANRGLLLITEDYPDKQEIMFNLLSSPDMGMISFEFNKANIIFEGFDLRPEIIELRGSEVDIRELYRQTINRLTDEEERINKLRQLIDSQNTNVATKDRIITALNKTIRYKNVIIQQQTDSIDSQKIVLGSLTERAQNQENEILKNLQIIDDQQDRMFRSNTTIEKQDRMEKVMLANLDSLNREISEKQKELEHKETMLSEKESLIQLKDKLIFMFIAVLVIVSVLVFLVFRAYKVNKSAKQVLARQKEELEAILAKLTQAQEQLVRSEKMASLGVLTAGLAHEINNPVNFINSGNIGLQKIMHEIIPHIQKYRDYYILNVSEKSKPGDEKEIDLHALLQSADLMMQSIKTGVDRTVSIIKSLRTFARSDEENIVPVNIHENIDLALTILHNQYKYSVDIHKNYGLLPEVECSPGKMNQVFMNLLSNAIQAIPERGTIVITTKNVPPDIIISIKDTGTGIRDDIKGKIFDPFFTTKDAGKGTGMGLSIVYSIIEEHNGTIVINSQEGMGTEFVITLPQKKNSSIVI